MSTKPKDYDFMTDEEWELMQQELIKRLMSTCDDSLKTMRSPCRACKHLRCALIPSCLAFPFGIPRDVFTGENFHDHPLPNDRGYQFELREELPDDFLVRLLNTD